MDNNPIELDCAVCLQKIHHPTQLPCGHVFCFLCVKGIAIQSKKCAMCRTDIPHDYLYNPILLDTVSAAKNYTEGRDTEYQWYYEGRNGWWKYDERSNKDLETAYNKGETECYLLLAGALYRVDFQNNIQVRNNDQTKRRRIRRDTPSLPSKGIAGIKVNIDIPTDISNETLNNAEESGTDHEHDINYIDLNSNDAEQDSMTEVAHTFSAIALRQGASSDLSDTENT